MYKILYEIDLEKTLKKIPKYDVLAILEKIKGLAIEPPEGTKKLVGRDGYRMRVGNYRVIYEIHDKQLIVIIIDIGPRADIYKKR